MHVAIDMRRLRLTHIHPDASILMDLVHLEGGEMAHVLFDSTASHDFLNNLDRVQLVLLVEHTTGHPPLFSVESETFRLILAEMIDGMAPPKVRRDELDAQIAYADLDRSPADAIQYRYVHGARRPRIVEDGLFPLKAPAPNGAHVATLAAKAAERAKKVPAAPAATPAALAPAKRPEAAMSITGEPVERKPRQRTSGSNTKGIIYSAADAAWESAGKPVDLSVIRKLRIEVMAKLVEDGMNRNTVSCTLGDWQKERIT